MERARAAGHAVVFTGRDSRRLQAVAERSGAHGLAADVGRGDDNARVVSESVRLMGGVDVLMNNAGYAYRAEIGAIDVDAMRPKFDINVFGLVDLTNRVVPLMKAQGEGDIINIASTSGMKGGAGGPRTRQQVGRPRHHPVLAGRVAAARHPSHLRLPVRSADEFGGRTGRNNPNKLYADDIAATIIACLDMPRRALWPELAIFATNPWKEN